MLPFAASVLYYVGMGALLIVAIIAFIIVRKKQG